MSATTAVPYASLRPLSLGELLDQAIRLYRRNFLKFIGIIAIVQVPLVLVQLILSALSVEEIQNLMTQAPSTPEEIFTPRYLIGVGGSLVVGILSFLLIQGVATAALTRAIADSRLGTPSGIAESYSKIGSDWLRLLGTLLLWGLILIVVVIWLIIPCIGWISGPGLLAFLAGIVGPLIAPIVVLERKGGFQAIRRAWDLARRRFWWLIGFAFILYLFNWLIVSGPTALVGFVMTTIVGSTLDSTSAALLNTVIQSITQLLLGLLYLPQQLSALTLLYFDLRVRTEGFDLALQTGDLSGQSADITQLISQAPPAASDSLLTSSEAGYFVALTLGVGMIYAIIFGIVGILSALLISVSSGAGL